MAVKTGVIAPTLTVSGQLEFSDGNHGSSEITTGLSGGALKVWRIVGVEFSINAEAVKSMTFKSYFVVWLTSKELPSYPADLTDAGLLMQESYSFPTEGSGTERIMTVIKQPIQLLPSFEILTASPNLLVGVASNGAGFGTSTDVSWKLYYQTLTVTQDQYLQMRLQECAC